MTSSTRTFTHDPEAVLDYLVDWSSWLATGDTIVSHTVDADDGITVDSSEINAADTGVIIWLSGGTVGENYAVVCHIETVGGREDDRTIHLMVRER